MKKGRKRIYRRSGLEDKIEANLKARGIKYGYESIKLYYHKQCCPECGCKSERGTYTPDFIIERPSGIPLVVEGKGYFDLADRKKQLFVQRDNPSADIRFLFQRDNPIRKGSPTKYSDWCIKNNFKYYIGCEVPQEWINEGELNEAKPRRNKQKAT